MTVQFIQSWQSNSKLWLAFFCQKSIFHLETPASISFSLMPTIKTFYLENGLEQKLCQKRLVWRQLVRPHEAQCKQKDVTRRSLPQPLWQKYSTIMGSTQDKTIIWQCWMSSMAWQNQDFAAFWPCDSGQFYRTLIGHEPENLGSYSLNHCWSESWRWSNLLQDTD